MNHFTRRTSRACGLTLPLVLALAACGGGGSDSSDNGSATAASLKLAGTAATGAAMANASIAISCAAGATTTVGAGTDGGYTASITGGTLPCVITATSSDGLTELHSVAAGTGSADTTANVTPLTELLVAKLAGSDPKTFAAGFTSATTISAADVSSAQTALLQTLTAAGVDTTAVSDIVGGAITAGSGTGYDGVLDQLKATITAAGTTLAELTTAVATTSSAGSDTTQSTVTTVLAPAASECSGLKTGTLRLLNFQTGETSLVQVDAKALTATMQGTTYTLTKNASCDYSINNGATRVLVANSGVAVLVTGSEAKVAIPEQKLDVAALAGTYVRVQYGPTFDAESGDFGTTVFAADGQNGLSVNCPAGYGNCVEDTQSKGKLVANANGGFDYMENGVSQARVFAFRNASGRNFLLAYSGDTVVALAAKEALALQAVGDASSFWQFTWNASGIGPISEDSTTITAVDTATGSVTRQFTSDSHFDTRSINTPFDGTRYRAPNACTSSTGGAFSCSGVVQLPFGGFVLTVSSVPTRHFMTVSVVKP